MRQRRRTAASVRRDAFLEAAAKVEATAASYRCDAARDPRTTGQQVWAVAAVTALGIAAALRAAAER